MEKVNKKIEEDGTCKRCNSGCGACDSRYLETQKMSNARILLNELNDIELQILLESYK